MIPETLTKAIMIAGLLGYLLGSVPFGLVLCRLFGAGDLRAVGSGNIGATNVLRTGRKGLALATLLLDGGKGAIAALLFTVAISPTAGLISGLFAVIGHNFPVWLRFQGGKGVATTLGTILATAWPVGLVACLTWALVAALTRISSLSALAALLAAPIAAVWLATGEHVAIYVMLAILGWTRHHENIRRLLKGEEPRIGGKSRP